MKRIGKSLMALAIVTLLVSSAAALDIQVAPRTLVLSSPGGNLTVHTDVPFIGDVTLTVDGTTVAAHTFADDCGNLVAQCDKQAAKDAIGDFKGKFTAVTVALDVDGASASEDIRVKK